MIFAEDEESFEHAFAGTGMEGRDDQMASESRTHTNVGRLFIPNFTDDQYLRVLAKKVTGSFGEIEAASFVDLSLHDTWHDLLSRIFDGNNVPSAQFGQPQETGVNRRGLAAAGRAREQQQAGSLAQEPLQLCASFCGKIKLTEGTDFRGVEKAQNNFFTRYRRVGGDPDITPSLERILFDAAILREGLLVRLQTRKEFDAPKKPLGKSPWHFGRRCNDAIEPERHRGGLTKHLEVDIACVGSFGLVNKPFKKLRRRGFRIGSVKQWSVLHVRRPDVGYNGRPGPVEQFENRDEFRSPQRIP
jgi:hypothetical protein